jgi:phosphoribosyl-ATP pyrophosphohydrolase/phosphoribosyl-AMP cyclohydrolase
MATSAFNELRFDEHGLIPAVVQDLDSGTVLMVGYMNLESLEKTITTGETHFWSRSRQSLWHKGETSGNTQKVRKISVDCDGDALLVQVEQKGNACHTGEYSCFFNTPFGDYVKERSFSDVMGRLARRIRQRKLELPPDSYTTHLFQSGTDKILKKIGEEAGEIIIAAKNHNHDEISWEVADLIYHLLVMLEAETVTLSDIAAELDRRARKKHR